VRVSEPGHSSEEHNCLFFGLSLLHRTAETSTGCGLVLGLVSLHFLGREGAYRELHGTKTGPGRVTVGTHGASVTVARTVLALASAYVIVGISACADRDPEAILACCRVHGLAAASCGPAVCLLLLLK